MATDTLKDYFRGNALIGVGTSSAKIAMHLFLTRQLVPQDFSGSANQGVSLRLLDLGPELGGIMELFCKDGAPMMLPHWRDYSGGAGRIPPVASTLFEKHKERLGEWPTARGNNIFLTNLSGGTGGGVSPNIVTLAPRGTKQWGIVNATLDEEDRQITNFCYNFPRLNLGTGWEWNAQSRAWGRAGEPEDSPCYRLLFLFDSESVREKQESGLISYDYGAGLRAELQRRATPGHSQEPLEEIRDRYLICNEFISRFIEMVALAGYDLPNTLNMLAVGGMSEVAAFVVPCFWPLNTDYEKDINSYTVVDYVMRAVRVGAMCPGVNPEEATGAVVLVQGPRRVVDGIEHDVKQQLWKLLRISSGMIHVYPIFNTLDGLEESNRVRVCVLLMTPSFATIRDLYDDPALTRQRLTGGINVWKSELRGGPGILDITAAELREVMDREADAEAIHYKFIDWYAKVKKTAEGIKGNLLLDNSLRMRTWGESPGQSWKNEVTDEIQNIKNQDRQRSDSGQQIGEGMRHADRTEQHRRD